MKLINCKKISVIMAVVALSLLSCEEQKIVTPAELPEQINTWLSTKFPGATVAQASTERDGFSKNYEVTLSDGTNVEFNGKGEVTDVKSTKSLPAGIVPDKIIQYVTKNYPGSTIISWELDGNGQQTQLDNSIKLEFNKAGDFTRIDQ